MKVYWGIADRWRRRKQDNYIAKLLTHKMRLKDVPEKLRQDIRYSGEIYIAGLRADRNRPLEEYAQDLKLLNIDIAIARARGDAALQYELEQLRWNYETIYRDCCKHCRK